MNVHTQPSPETPVFNPFSPEFLADPYPAYAQLRANAPMLKTPLEFWVASRHADVAEVLKSKTFGKDFEGRWSKRYDTDFRDEPALYSLSLNMLSLNPPDHTRVRGLVAKAFTPRIVESWRPRVEQLVDELLDEAMEWGGMDIATEFAHRLPVHVICDMLGIPAEDRGQFLERSRVSGRVVDPTPMSRQELDDANENSLYMRSYFEDLCARRRADPQDDLTTVLVQAEEDGERLSADELYANIILLFAAGHETTANLIGNGMLALHRNPDQLDLLRRGDVDWADVVEELLRYDSSVQLTGRVALQDTELGGQELAAGESVVALLGSANRDPDAYDDPDRLDVTRAGIRAMSFGGGIHICLGAQLTRLEGQVAFRRLFERLPDLRLDPDDLENPKWRQTITLRGLTQLKATW